MNRQELEHRFERFGMDIIQYTRQFNHSKINEHLKSQIIRSGAAPALQYAESGDAESVKDFIHKLKIALKELRETRSILRIIKGGKFKPDPVLERLIVENGELIAILISSVKTSKRNLDKLNLDE
jgi:four helix bundle protein